MANFMKMMKQAADMQKNMDKAQEALAALELEHSAGGGAVRVTITGDGNITAIRLTPPLCKAAIGNAGRFAPDCGACAQDQARETAATEKNRPLASICRRALAQPTHMDAPPVGRRLANCRHWAAHGPERLLFLAQSTSVAHDVAAALDTASRANRLPAMRQRHAQTENPAGCAPMPAATTPSVRCGRPSGYRIDRTQRRIPRTLLRA